jgi:flagellar basal body rod protein FlgB
MNIPVLITDNVTELLVKIIKFTKVRQEVLTQNVNNMHAANFTPQDMPVDEFSDSLDYAIDEHTLNQRLVLCDTANVKFGAEGDFEVKPVTDRYAKELLKDNPDEYLEMQINKLLENSLNQRVAETLLKQKEGVVPNFE